MIARNKKLKSLHVGSNTNLARQQTILFDKLTNINTTENIIYNIHVDARV